MRSQIKSQTPVTSNSEQDFEQNAETNGTSQRLKVIQHAMNAFPEPGTYDMVTDFAEQLFQWSLKPKCINKVEWEITIDTLFAKAREVLVIEIEANICYGYFE